MSKANEELVRLLVIGRGDLFRVFEPFVTLCWNDHATARYWAARILSDAAEREELFETVEAICVVSAVSPDEVAARETLIALLPVDNPGRRQEERIVLHYYLRHDPARAAERLRKWFVPAQRVLLYALFGWALRGVAPDLTVAALHDYKLSFADPVKHLWLPEVIAAPEPDPVVVSALVMSNHLGSDAMMSLLELLPRLPATYHATILTDSLIALATGWSVTTDAFTQALRWLDTLVEPERVAVLIVLVRTLTKAPSFLRHLSHPIDVLPWPVAREALIEAHGLAMTGVTSWPDYRRWVQVMVKEPLPAQQELIHHIVALIENLPERRRRQLAADFIALIDTILTMRHDSLTEERRTQLSASRAILERQ